MWVAPHIESLTTPVSVCCSAGASFLLPAAGQIAIAPMATNTVIFFTALVFMMFFLSLCHVMAGETSNWVDFFQTWNREKMASEHKVVWVWPEWP
jgi:hypothetical protein